MTKEEILAMAGGRKLDELVAKEIFGSNKPDFIPKDALALSLVGTPFHYESWTCLCLYNKGDIPEWYADPYSTDISAAWQVKERLNGEGLLLSLIDLCPTGEELIRAEFWDNMGLVPSKIVGEADAKSASEAICKAALLVELEVGMTKKVKEVKKNA